MNVWFESHGVWSPWAQLGPASTLTLVAYGLAFYRSATCFPLILLPGHLEGWQMSSLLPIHPEKPSSSKSVGLYAPPNAAVSAAVDISKVVPKCRSLDRELLGDGYAHTEPTRSS